MRRDGRADEGAGLENRYGRKFIVGSNPTLSAIEGKRIFLPRLPPMIVHISCDAAMEKKLKHLEFIQEAINRMARNSFMLKGWTVILVAASIAFIAEFGDVQYILAACFVAVAFWVLDGYFLSQERLFRALYDEVRMLDEDAIDFSMDTRSYRADSRNSWIRAIFSQTLLIFYLCVGLIFLAILASGVMRLW